MDTAGKRLRLLYADILGLERGKYLFGEPAAQGTAAFCIGVYPLTTDKEILPIPGLQFDIGLPDVEAHLDRDTLRHGWEPNTVVGIGDLTFRGRALHRRPPSRPARGHRGLACGRSRAAGRLRARVLPL